MTYKDYFRKLSEIETRLFEEGYWKLAFVVDIDGDNLPMIKVTGKWKNMMTILNSHYPVKVIPPEVFYDYLDNPDKYKYIKPPKSPREKRIKSIGRKKVKSVNKNKPPLPTSGSRKVKHTNKAGEVVYYYYG